MCVTCGVYLSGRRQRLDSDFNGKSNCAYEEGSSDAGFYKSPWHKMPYPRLQIRTIEELLKGREIECPPLGQVNITFKKAPKAKDKKTMSQMHLSHEEEKQRNSKSPENK